MGRTIGQIRVFTCKACGREVSESLYKWRKKPQAKKNICLYCLECQNIVRQTAMERVQCAPLYLK